MTGGRRYTFHVEDTHDDPDKLAEALGVFERLGYPTVECPALEERLRRRARNKYLRGAHALMTASSCWGKCVQLRKEVRTFESTVWLSWQDQEAPPERCSELRRYLFEVFRRGPVPQTARQLRNIVAKCAGPCDFGGEGIS